MSRHNAWKHAACLAALVIFVIGCASRDARRQASRPAPLRETTPSGQVPARLGSDPVSDLPGRIIVGILSAIGDPDRNTAGETIILVPDLVNRSSALNADVIELGDRLRGELALAGAPSRLAFVAAEGLGAGGRANYILQGEVYAVQRQGQRSWELFFTLFDVNAQTGERQDRRWENARGYLVPR